MNLELLRPKAEPLPPAPDVPADGEGGGDDFSDEAYFLSEIATWAKRGVIAFCVIGLLAVVLSFLHIDIVIHRDVGTDFRQPAPAVLHTVRLGT